MTAFSRDDVQSRFDVSREIMDRLDIHATLLAKWSPRINLVSRDSLAQVWHRHIADSAQLWLLRPPEWNLWLDVGSGAGFPGLVIAAFAAGGAGRIRLVESDARKSAFLQTVVREADLPADIVTARIEDLPPQNADILSARALAPLESLLEISQNHRSGGGISLFPKGRTVHKEMEEASRNWHFAPRVHPSLTDPAAGIVEIGVFDRV